MADVGDKRAGRASVSASLLVALFACFAYKLWMLHASGFMVLLESYQRPGGFSPTQVVALEDLSVLAAVFLLALLPSRGGGRAGAVLGWLLVLAYLLDIQAMQFFNARLTLPNLLRFANDLQHARGLLGTEDYVAAAAVLVACVLLRKVRLPLPASRGLAASLLLAAGSLPWWVGSGVGANMLMEQATRNMFRLNLQVVTQHDPSESALAWLQQEFPELAQGVEAVYDGSLIPEDGSEALPDVVLLVSESLSRVDSARSGGTRDRMPGIDALQETGVTFTHAVANGFNSSDALASLLLGADPLPTNLITGNMARRFPPERFAANNVVAAAAARGYTTIAISNGPLDFQRNDLWLKEMGFDIVQGARSHRFADEKIYSFGGPSDEVLFEKAVQSLRHWPSPVFMLVFTVGLHKPYRLPEGAELVDGDLQDNMLAYVDRTTVQFHKKLERSDLFEKGVLLLVGDHRRMDPLETEEVASEGELGAQGRVVAALMGRGVPEGVQQDVPLNQTDFNLMLNHLVRGQSLEESWASYRRALHAGLGQPMIYSVLDPDRGLVIFQFEGEEPELVSLRADLKPGVHDSAALSERAQAYLMLSTDAVAKEQGVDASDTGESYGRFVRATFELTAAAVEDATRERGLNYEAGGARTLVHEALQRLHLPAFEHLAAAVRVGWERLPNLRVDLEQDAWVAAVMDRFLFAHAFEVIGQVPLRRLQEQLQGMVSTPAADASARLKIMARWKQVTEGMSAGLEVRDLQRHHAPNVDADVLETVVTPPDAGMILGHMGAPLERPENSMSSFRRALALGADGIECDLRLAADGTVFAFHDRSVRRMTGVDAALRSMTRDEVLALRLREPGGSNVEDSEPPAMLSQVLDELPTDAVLWLELKPEEADELAQRVGDLLEAHAHRDRIIVSSFSGRLLEQIATRFDDIRIALEFPRLSIPEVDALIDSPYASRLVVSSRLLSQLDPQALRRASAAGLESSEFVPNRFDAIRSALGHGVTYVQTNRVQRALALRRRP